MNKLLRYLVFGYALTFNAGVAFGTSIPTWGQKKAPKNVQTDVVQSILNIINFILGVVAMICVLMIIFGMVTGGANAIKYALVGLVICGLAYAMIIVVSTVVLTRGVS
ncbi:MAG: hypothetical protein WC788_02000 [Candidatus Paceibacterota bacterium]|jgi:hypothetical protein